ADLTGFEQLSQTKAVDASIVADAGQVLYACIPQCGDERLGNAAEAEATHSDHLAIGHDAFQCFVGTCINFIHYTLPCAKQRNVDETLNAAYRASPDYASCASCSREEHTCHALEFGLRPGRRTTRDGVDAHHDGRSSRAWGLFALYGDFDRTFQAGSTHPNQSSIDHHRGGPQNGTQKIAGDACQNDITPGVCTRQATGGCIVHARLFHVSEIHRIVDMIESIQVSPAYRHFQTQGPAGARLRLFVDLRSKVHLVLHDFLVTRVYRRCSPSWQCNKMRRLQYNGPINQYVRVF